jgi:hypothetical protein
MDVPDEQLNAMVDEVKEKFTLLYVIRENLSEIPRKKGSLTG